MTMTPIAIDARNDYHNMCTTTGTDAVKFENQTLSAGAAFLPDYAVAVLNDETPTAEYFGWLQDQLAEAAGIDAPQ